MQTLNSEEFSHLSFRLSDEYISQYDGQTPPWGFPIGGGNTLGELTWLTKYSRTKANGQKETWTEGCRRVVEGTYSILRDHCLQHRTPWNAPKAQRAAETMYSALWNMKWTPPGRGLWMMGTPFVSRYGSASLQSCAFLSTEKLGTRNPTLPFVRLMEMSMLGVGVGFDTRGAGKLKIHAPDDSKKWTHVIPDSREGWCESVDHLLQSFFLDGHGYVDFDYSEIRPAGTPIKGFGGTAAGSAYLETLHDELRRILNNRIGEELSSTTIVDVCNMIGKCVVSGNIRRSAELALGYPEDQDFLELKDWQKNPERMGSNGWGHLSNNSVIANSGDDLSHIASQIAVNGEPGVMYLDMMQKYGRLVDQPNNKDHRVKGGNPCLEMSLEDNELCCLVETYPTNHDSLQDYLKTLKVAYLYAKAVTLVPTHWPETNEVMTRNRRIGTSMSGTATFAEERGWAELRKWCEAGYKEITDRDNQYSEWLGVRSSIKISTSKPAGTTSLLPGVTPGVHWPVASGQYFRRVRYSKNDSLVPVLRSAGYHVEPSVSDPEADVVVTFPTVGPEIRSERDVSVWEKVQLAALIQRYWSDNMVSATFSFKPEEEQEIESILRAMDGQMKVMSFLPLGEELSGGAFPQMPYEKVSDEEFSELLANIKPLDFDAIYASGREADGEKFCTTDVCEVKF